MERLETKRVKVMTLLFKNKYYIRAKRLLLILALLAAIKAIFAGIHMDEEYAITLSYRLLKGDKLFRDIWDPHQTSAFLMEALIHVYLKITHTTTGIVVFLKTCGILIKLGISAFFYRTLSCLFYEKEDAFLLACLYFSFSSKFLIAVPEFTQMACWSYTLVFLLILRMNLRKKGLLSYSERNKGELYLTGILIGTGISCMVLAYPSMVLVALLFACMLLYQKEYKYLVVTATTILAQAFIYILYLGTYLTAYDWIRCVQNMIYTSGAHSDSFIERMQLYGTNLCTIIFILGTEGLFAFFIFLGSRKKIPFICVFIFTGLLFQIILWVCRPIRYHKCYDYTILFMLLGYFAYKAWSGLKSADNEEISWLTIWQGQAVLGGIFLFVSAALLTNLPLFVSIRLAYPAILLAGAFGLLRLEKQKGVSQRKISSWRILMLLGCFSLTFIRGFSLDDDDGEIRTIFDLGKVITAGPEAGLVTSYMKGYMILQDISEWDQYVLPEDNVLLVDSCTIPLLFEDVTVASYTTISTPTYNDGLETYYKQHPEKYPDVVVLSSWYGELTPVGGNSYMVNWVNEVFQADQIVDGSFYRYYIKRN